MLWSLPTMCAESDCACAAAWDAPAMGPASVAQTCRRPPDLYLASLPGAHTLAFNPRRPEVVSVLNPPALRLLHSFDRPTALQRAGDFLPAGAPTEAIQAAYQLATLGLLAPDHDPQSPIPNPQSPLTAWLHLTDACNLACTYCYVAKSSKRMDEATGRAAVEAVFRSALRHGYQAVKLKYAGGEPTLNFGLVRVLHEQAARLATRHGLGLQEVLLSNGVALTPTMLDFLKAAGIRLMISLDGLAAAHDRQRPLVNGGASSDLVLAGLDRALAHGLTPHVSVTISPASAAGLAETTSYLLDRDLPFNWNFVRAHPTPSSSPARGGELIPPFPGREGGWGARSLLADLLAAVTVIEARLPRRRLIDGLLDRSSFAGVHVYPCAAGHDYIAIGSHGEVAQCHMTLGQPLGDVATDDLLSLPRPAAAPQNVSVEEKTVCQACRWRYVCAGGCPLSAQWVTGRPNTRSPYCAVYQALLSELLRLEGLRILKWQAGTVM
jgi:uncharacterized protein